MSILHKFRGPGGGFGLQSYKRARAAGLNPIHIARAMGSSGMSLGWRARDAIIRDSASQAFQIKQQRNTARSAAADYSAQLNQYKSQLDNYRNQVSDLTSKYQSQITATAEANKRASDFENQFTAKSREYDEARAEADRYKEEAVGAQLRGLRSGATTSSRQDSGGGIGDLSGGRTRFSADIGDDSSRLADRVKDEGGLTDSVLNRKGPVVERMSSSARRQSAPSSQPNRGLSRGAGTGSYYASRFG